MTVDKGDQVVLAVALSVALLAVPVAVDAALDVNVTAAVGLIDAAVCDALAVIVDECDADGVRDDVSALLLELVEVGVEAAVEDSVAVMLADVDIEHVPVADDDVDNAEVLVNVGVTVNAGVSVFEVVTERVARTDREALDVSVDCDD